MEFNDEIAYPMRVEEYKFKARMEVSSDSDAEEDKYEPLFVKSIQSYP